MRQETVKEFSDSNNEILNLPASSQMRYKVPQITILFWIIKILCTTVGETASDFLNVNLGFGLTGTAIAAGILLAIISFLQFKVRNTSRLFTGRRLC